MLADREKALGNYADEMNRRREDARMNRKKDASQLLPALALVVFGVWPLGCCDCAVAFANSPAAPPDRRVEGAFAVPACSGISSRVALLMVLALAKMRGAGLTH